MNGWVMVDKDGKIRDGRTGNVTIFTDFEWAAGCIESANEEPVAEDGPYSLKPVILLVDGVHQEALL